MVLVISGSDSGKDLNELWKRRMGHLHHGALRILKEMITSVIELGMKHDDVCNECVLGKYSKVAFPRSDNKSDSVLQLIHSDIFGPMSIRSLRGYKYFITFIDDHSRKT